jgi:uncharacterized membrane protein YphA (DoxX/SURF4 family)
VSEPNAIVPPAPASGAPALRSPWDRFFFEPQSPSPMVLVRFAWGLTAAVWALTLLPDVDPLLTDGALRYDRARGAGSWNPLDWVDWSSAPMVTTVLLLVAALATAVGYRTRLSSAVAALSMVALLRTNTTVFNSGDLVLRQIGVAVALAPAGLLLSLDALRRRGGLLASADIRRAPWALRLLQLQLAVGYTLSAWAKIRGASWHDGTALGQALRIEDLQRVTPPEWLFDQDVLLNLLTWATVAFEASFLFAVWNRRLRPWVLGLGVAFHLGIDVFFDVGFFSIAMWIGYLAFVPPEVADRWVERIARAVRLDRRSPPVPLAVEPAE